MSEGPEAAVRRFLDAVLWGEHMVVWDLLGDEGRRTVLRVATARGMHEALAARLRDGTASRAELDVFLADLVNGLRNDLAVTDVEALELSAEPSFEEGRASVLLLAPVAEGLASVGPLPVGTADLLQERGEWRIERLSLRTTTRPA